MHDAITRLRALHMGEDKFAARFIVLGEYLLHHLKEEEREIFPMLEPIELDWEAMARAIDARRAEAHAGRRTPG